MSNPALSVLDLVSVGTGQTSAQAVAASLDLVAHAERLGLRRYWFAEHHNMPAVASTSPPVLIAAAAARTSRIRVGSGGVMLPNHAPLVVAEQFATLSAIAPGRIDLGLGRAPGSDPVVTQLLRMSGPTSDVDRFPQNIQDIRALVSPEGATVEFTNGKSYSLHATPAATDAPEVWILGSSEYSARLAASLGLPYVFANHFSGEGLHRALDLYRTEYTPSDAYPEPKTLATVNVVAAASADEAEARALPQQRMIARLRSNRPLVALETIEDAQAAEASDGLASSMLLGSSFRSFVGETEDVAQQLRDFAVRHDVDEVMLSPVAGRFAAEPLDTAPGRIQTLELLTAALA